VTICTGGIPDGILAIERVAKGGHALVEIHSERTVAEAQEWLGRRGQVPDTIVAIPIDGKLWTPIGGTVFGDVVLIVPSQTSDAEIVLGGDLPVFIPRIVSEHGKKVTVCVGGIPPGILQVGSIVGFGSGDPPEVVVHTETTAEAAKLWLTRQGQVPDTIIAIPIDEKKQTNIRGPIWGNVVLIIPSRTSDAQILLGGKPSAFYAGQIARSKRTPVFSVSGQAKLS
jgi:hypothetical protein